MVDEDLALNLYSDLRFTFSHPFDLDICKLISELIECVLFLISVNTFYF